MSTETEDDQLPESEAIVEPLQRWYHVPALAAVFIYMLWTRTRAYDRFVRDGEVLFSGNDPYYHYRATMYSVKNWPSRVYGEPWTLFPEGQNVGNFGTLMDQVVATVALIVGLGDPSAQEVAKISLLAPAIFGALTTIPAYFLAKKLGGNRISGLTAAGLVALVPQASWITRTSVGYYDHHVAETLAMSIAVFAMVNALVVVGRERPVFEQVQDRDWDGLRPTLVASALAGIALAAYLLTWAAGVVLVGIFGVFFVIAMSVVVLRGESPEHLAFAGAISHLVAFIAILPWIQSFTIETTTLSLLQLIPILGIVLGCSMLAALARTWEDRDVDEGLYPITVAVIGLVFIGLLWLLLPEASRTVWRNLQRILFLGQSDTTLTISEAQSMLDDDRAPVTEQFWNGYGFAFFTSMVAGLWMAARGLLAKRTRSEYLLITIWTAFLLLMTLTQVRFHYYLVIPVAVLNGWLVAQVLQIAAFPTLEDFEDLQAYHVLTVFAIIMLLFVPIASPIAAATAADRSGDMRPGSSVTTWDDSLDWMSENTPEPGTYGGADNEMEYYGPFEEVQGDYEYPPGAYGVMSWWDYGHWITVEGERIPNANPFQSGARGASAYLQATNETRANLMLEAISSSEVRGGQLDDMSNAELRAAIEAQSEQEAGEDTRYVVIDDQMVGDKFYAITQWAGANFSDYYTGQRYQLNNQNTTLSVPSQTFRETMLSRLYFGDAAGLSHYRLVHEVDSYSVVGGYLSQSRAGPFTTLRYGWSWDQAQQTAAQLRQASFFGQALRAGQNAYIYDADVESTVKTFERVEGATLTGEAEPNESVIVTVPIETSTNRTFRYSQQTTASTDGTFEITVPYPTNNELGPADGYTDAAAVANGTYTVRAGGFRQPRAQATDVSVPEPAIYDGSTIDVDLEPVEGGSGNDSTDGNASGSMSEASATSDSTASGSASSASTSGGAATAGTASVAGTDAISTDAFGALGAPANALTAPVRTLVESLAAEIAG